MSITVKDGNGDLQVMDPPVHGAPATGETVDAGGSGLLGWLSGIRKRLPAALTGSGNLKTAIVEELPAGTQVIGKLGANSGTDIGDVTLNNTSSTPVPAVGIGTVVVPTVTVSTSPAYSVGDNVGGKLTLSNAVRSSGGTAYLRSLLLVDTSNQKNALELLLFNADPSSSTITDNAAFVLHANDVAKLIRRYSLAAADYVTLDSKGILDLLLGDRPLVASGSTSLYAALVIPATGGTPTYAATSAISVRFGFLWD